MKVAVRKLQMEDAAKLQMLVAENIDAIEPGLVVLDSRLLLGHATIDVVGLGTNGALVLIATGLVANEDMLLKAVEAYSWCREYPESLERLYPSCIISDERPPRLVFVVERMPDAFHRKIKQIGFPEVDCVEFRLLDVEGAPAVYFEPILRLRRPAPMPAAASHVEPPAEPPVEEPAGGENVIAMNGPVAARATSLKLQKLLNHAVVESVQSAPRASERLVTPSREPAAIVTMVSRPAAASAPRVERPRPELVTLREAALISAATPVAAAPAVVRQPEPVVVAPALPTAVAGPEAAAPDLDLMAEMQRALAALEHRQASAKPAAVNVEPQPIEPKLELVAEPEPVLAIEPKLELVARPEPVLAIEPKLELADEVAPAALVEEPDTRTIVAAAEPAPASTPGAVIPALNTAAPASRVPSLGGERISLRSLPELSLRPSTPIAMPRPAPIPRPTSVVAPAVTAKPVDEPQEPPVSFKDLAAALLGPAPAPGQAVIAPAVSASVDDARVAPVLEPTPSAPLELVAVEAETPVDVVVEPVSPAMAAAVTELEPALTVEALIKNTLAPVAAAPPTPAAPIVAASAAEGPAREAAKPAAGALPTQFEGLKFPNDGVLTRQWMEFLGQMSTTK